MIVKTTCMVEMVTIAETTKDEEPVLRGLYEKKEEMLSLKYGMENEFHKNNINGTVKEITVESEWGKVAWKEEPAETADT